MPEAPYQINQINFGGRFKNDGALDTKDPNYRNTSGGIQQGKTTEYETWISEYQPSTGRGVKKSAVRGIEKHFDYERN